MQKIAIALGIVLLLAVNVTQAEEFRVASVDMNRIINESSAGKAKREALQAKSEAKRKELDTKKAALRDLEKKLSDKKVKEDSKEADEYRSKARDLARLVKDSETDLKNDYLRSTKELVTKASKVIEEYSKKNSLSLVLEHSDNQPSAILYGSATLDITDDILKELNSKNSKG